ncbi:MAG TPA: DNA repair protein RadA [Chloroflexota bacterium]
MRTRTEFVCRECGYRAPRALGRCPECDTWGSLEPAKPAAAPVARLPNGIAARPVRLREINAADIARLPVAAAEFARVLGGGIVPGSVILIGGDPGVGKSTLLTQLAHDIASTSGPTLYVSGEESLAQSALRARRMGLDADNLLFLSETDVETVIGAIREAGARLVIVDSIQSVTTADVEALPGSVSQLRESAQRFMHLAKSTGTSVILVGHVTKDGAIAGPKVLEHMVDTVLYLEGERFNQYRLLRSTKNRFGPTYEVGVFEMRDHGLAEVANPSSVFLSERDEASPGSVVTVTMEGTRALLVEVQALASRTSLAIPRRTANGFDGNRLHLIGAVLSRRLGIPLHDQDIYLNVAGGMRVDEPAVDLAAALAIVSSVRDHAMPNNTVAVGEVGLSGELRSVGYLEQRLRAASQLGFVRAVVPRTAGLPHDLGGITLTPAATLREAVRSLQL